MNDVNDLIGRLKSNTTDPNQKVHVHSEPNTKNSNIIHNATPGDRVEVLSSITEPDGIWYRVQDVQNSNIIGWVRNDVIALEPHQPTSVSTSRLTTLFDTNFKASLDPNEHEEYQVKKDTTFELSARKTVSEQYDFITLANNTLLAGRNSWFVYRPHVRIT